MPAKDMLIRRALFGGTFDPVHGGHLAAARAVLDQVPIEDFRWLPAGTPPHRSATHATAEQRMAMLRLALQDSPEFTIDEREMRRSGPSFMVDTLLSLRAEYPNDALILILGQDALNGLDRWHEWQQIPDLAHLVVMTRPGETPDYSPELAEILLPRLAHDPAALGGQPSGLVLPVTVTPSPISSTGVRATAGDAAQLRERVPDVVAEFIERHGLYRERQQARDL